MQCIDEFKLKNINKNNYATLWCLFANAMQNTNPKQCDNSLLKQ